MQICGFYVNFKLIPLLKRGALSSQMMLKCTAPFIKRLSRCLGVINSFYHFFLRLENLYSFSTEQWKAEVKGTREWSKGEKNRVWAPLVGRKEGKRLVMPGGHCPSHVPVHFLLVCRSHCYPSLLHSPSCILFFLSSFTLAYALKFVAASGKVASLCWWDSRLDIQF